MSTTRISLIVLGFIAIVAYFTLFTVLEVTLCPAAIVKVSPSAGVAPPQVADAVKLPD